MHRLISKNFLSIFPLLVVLVSCQNASSVNQAEKDINLESDNGQLDLSQFTMEQQKLERLEAEATLLEIRQNRIIIPPDDEEVGTVLNQLCLNFVNVSAVCECVRVLIVKFSKPLTHVFDMHTDKAS